jgi:hypothetical protein
LIVIDNAVAFGELEKLVELFCGASVSIWKRTRICSKPTGAPLATPSVQRKSRSPSAETMPDLSGTSMAVATALRVTSRYRGLDRRPLEIHVSQRGR